MAGLISDVGGRGREHAVAVRSMFDRISPTYDLLNRLMSVGIDKRWRARALELLAHRLPAGPLLDYVRGHARPGRRHGDALCRAASCLPTDFAREMLVRGRGKVKQRPADRGRLRCTCRFATTSLAGMTCSFGMRNLSSPDRGAARGAAHPQAGRRVRGARVLSAVHPAHARVPRRLRALRAAHAWAAWCRASREAYAYLARSMQGFYTRAEFAQLARDVGFDEVESEDLTLRHRQLVSPGEALTMSIVVGISGASGAPYALRLLELLTSDAAAERGAAVAGAVVHGRAGDRARVRAAACASSGCRCSRAATTARRSRAARRRPTRW